MATYSVQDFVGKTIYAKKRIPLFRWASDDSPVIGYVEKNQRVGILRAWLEPKPGRSKLYFEFDDPRRGDFATFYVPWSSDSFDLPQLRFQGVTSLEEQAEAELPLLERLGGKALGIVGGLGLLYVAGKIITRK